MLTLLEALVKRPFWVLLFLAALSAAFLSCYTVNDWKPAYTGSVNWFFGTLSIAFAAASIGLYLAEAFLLETDVARLFRSSTIVDCFGGFETQFRHKSVSILFGVFEELAVKANSIAVLPCGECFDESCLYDQRTVMGAFLHKTYDGKQLEEIVELYNSALAKFPTEAIRVRGEEKRSYGLGTCVPVFPPFGPVTGLIFAATAAGGDSLRADLPALFKVLDGVRCIMVERRVARVSLPLLGAGHGGLNPELSYLLVLAGMLQAKASDTGGAIGDIAIVIYQPAGKQPIVSRRAAKYGLRRLVALYTSASA